MLTDCSKYLAASEIVLAEVLAAKGDADARAAAEHACALYEAMGTAPGLARARAMLERFERRPR